ncbi:MAG: helix-turn-helix transcriptional regulator [Alphaproteobacteria bacterium]|nr:helix-turn-helix transcriptional regulator [Alphaproteobacteria bacterium]
MDRLNPEDIYEGAFIAEKWPAILHEMATTVNAVGGGLFIVNTDVQNWTASLGLKESLSAFVEGQVFQGMGRKARVFEVGQHSFITEADAFTEDELDHDPLYRDFLRPRGLGWSARTAVRIPTGDNIVIALERPFKLGPVPQDSLKEINTLRPHLARAALMAARMQLERAQAATATLSMLGLPALLFDVKGRVLAANDLIEKLPELVLPKAFGQVALSDRRANHLLQQSIDGIRRRQHNMPLSFSVCNEHAAIAKIAHIVPICGESKDVFVRSAGILVLTPVNSETTPATQLVQSLFDFTPAEARVAQDIAKGETVDEIASANALSVSTVRSHMRSILEKTGCHRQLEVATLLNSLSIIRK